MPKIGSPDTHLAAFDRDAPLFIAEPDCELGEERVIALVQSNVLLAFDMRGSDG